MQLTCKTCDEYRQAALRKNGYCHNCSTSNGLKRRKAKCFICGLYASVEKHHIIPQALNIQSPYANKTLDLCLNCHAVITRKFVNREYNNKLHKKSENLETKITNALLDLVYMLYEKKNTF